MTVRYGAVTVDWLGNATVRVEGQTGVVVYVDPGRYGVLDGYDARDGDLILVTHADHYDPDGIRRVAREDAIVVVHEAVGADGSGRADESPDDLPYEVERVRADEDFILGPLDLFTTPAYNVPGGPHTRDDGAPYHREGEGCGYGVTIDGVTAFYPGDSDALDLHEELAVDVLLAPIGGAYAMDRHEAADLAEAMTPGLVLPVHYDTTGPMEADAEAFVVDVATRGVPVVLDDPNEEPLQRPFERR